MRSRLTRQAGEAIRKLRLSKGWTLLQLSEKSGVPLSTLSKLELGQSSLTYDKILRICRALDVDPGLTILQETQSSPAPSGRRAVIRAEEGEPSQLGPHPIKVAAHDLLSKCFTPIVCTLTARTLAEHGAMQTLPGEAYIFMLEGAAMLHSEVYAPLKLNTGDAVFFDGTMNHALLCLGDGPGKALIVLAGDEGPWREAI